MQIHIEDSRMCVIIRYIVCLRVRQRPTDNKNDEVRAMQKVVVSHVFNLTESGKFLSLHLRSFLSFPSHRNILTSITPCGR